MLVTAGEEENIIAGKALEAGNGVSNSGAVCMTDMKLGTGVINRGSNVEAFSIFTEIHDVPPKYTI